MASLLERVQEVVADKLSVDTEEVTPDASFTEDLNADSLDLVELIMASRRSSATTTTPSKSPTRTPSPSPPSKRPSTTSRHRAQATSPASRHSNRNLLHMGGPDAACPLLRLRRGLMQGLHWMQFTITIVPA